MNFKESVSNIKSLYDLQSISENIFGGNIEDWDDINGEMSVAPAIFDKIQTECNSHRPNFKDRVIVRIGRDVSQSGKILVMCESSPNFNKVEQAPNFIKYVLTCDSTTSLKD